MLIAVSAETNAGLDAPVNGHFGHSPYFTLVEVTDEQIGVAQAIANPHYQQHEPGAIPAFIHAQGADVMVTGGMGSRAAGFFQQYGIQTVTGASGSVREAVQAYLGGQISGVAPCHEHAHRCGDAHSDTHHHNAP
ncbi:MAG: NifB/NifX family molybdenum-iron cluster-binding protein [Alphaproteobacteria bacterium]|nr:NifB/NifX family molybdenum-iron cluster-binding protein [Alphaproteobacteria bacterium]